MNTLRMTIFSALFTALIIVGAYLKIPFGPIPLVLANFFVLLAGAILGPRWGAASVGLYLLLGIVGLPVFASGSGIAYIAGPTGGFLIGYLPAAFAAALICRRERKHLVRDLTGLIAGAAIIYLCGIPWLKVSLQMSWAKSFAVGMIPFLLGDAIKIAGAAAILQILYRQYPEIFKKAPTV